MQNKFLIIPCAGLSSRYPSSKPKWLLTLPNNNIVLVNLIKNYSYIRPKKIFIAILKIHENKYNATKLVLSQVDDKLKNKIHFIIINKLTLGPADTIYKVLLKTKINGKIFIKDCDSWYDLNTKLPNGNFVSVGDLRNEKHIKRISEKSFVSLNKHKKIISIIEKKITSNYFSAGMYAFESSYDYIKFFKEVKKIIINEIFLSHVIMHMILKGEHFEIELVKSIIDLGTKDDWDKYFKDNSNIILILDQIITISNNKIILKITNTKFDYLKKLVQDSIKKQNPIIIFNSFKNINLIKNFIYKIPIKKFKLVNSLNNSSYVFLNNKIDSNTSLEEK